MNTTAKALIFAVVSVASAAAIGMGLADRATPAAKPAVIKLETVVIYGQRAQAEVQQQVAAAVQIEKLPRVEIEGRSMAVDTGVQVAAAAAAAATAGESL